MPPTTFVRGRELPQEVSIPILHEPELPGGRLTGIIRWKHQQIHVSPAHNFKAQRVLRERRELIGPRREYRILDAEIEWNGGHIAGIPLSLGRIDSAGQEE